MIVKKPKMLIGTLFVMIFVMALAAVGCTFTGTNGNSGKDVTLYERAGVTIAIPNEYAGQLLVDPVAYDDEATLIRVYQKSTYEKYGGMGFLFSITRYSQAQYEQFLSSDGSGRSFFAKDDTFYYGFFFATDMQAPGDHEAFSQLFSAVGDYVKSDMITRNGLTAYSDDEFFNKTYTYDSEHIFLSYYPYYAYNGSKEEVWTLILSQPATQGAAGIWCVERWKDQNGNIYPYFPNENGIPASEYYAARQAAYESGSDTSWLDPKQVALAFVKRVFEHTPATINSFSMSDNTAASTGNIHDYLPGLLAGKAVSDYELLPCLENFTRATWSELDEAYGRDWWNPLWAALRDAAVSDGRSPRDAYEQFWRNYYLGKAMLAADGAYTEGLADILALQWDYDPVVYSDCLRERFSAAEAANLRQFLLSFNERIFGLRIPGTGGALCLDAYPVDFPFNFNLAEKSRDRFRAESYGPGMVVESDGLQVTFLNPCEDVYTVVTIRAVKQGYAAAGVAIGDTEAALLAQWRDKPLRRLSGISYDDAAWFGGCNLAYAYTPEYSTKSVLYLIKDGMVAGIELINGLDGAVY